MRFKYDLKIFYLILLFTHSCKSDRKIESYNIQSEKINEEWIGKNVILPESLVKLKNNNSHDNPKFHIIVYYNGDCGICYLQLSKWESVIKDLEILNRDISFKFILSGNSSAVIKANLENLEFPLDNVYHDEKNELSEKYNFLLNHEFKHSSMLLGEDNRILYIGNPSVYEKTNEKYIELIKP